MGRERQARLERRALRVEEAAKRKSRRRYVLPVVLLVGLAAVLGTLYYTRGRNTDTADSSNSSNPSITEDIVTATIKTDKGDIVVELDHKAAPKTVETR
jgi:hypothetical protein